MKVSAAQLSLLIKAKIEGDSDKSVSKLSRIEDANADSLSFIANPKYESMAADTHAGLLLVTHQFKAELAKEGTTLLRVEDPYSAFSIVQAYFNADFEHPKGVHQRALIDDSAVIGEDCYIGANTIIEAGCVIGNEVCIYPNSFVDRNSNIGDGTVIYSGVNIYRDSKIGKSCILHSGAVIGSDGFGFAPLKDGSYHKIFQAGNVIIEDNVEIGANTCIDRATLGSTIIKTGAKLDNLVQIAHNVKIGKHTAMAAMSGVSGSAEIGNYCMIGGQVGFAGHIKVGDKVLVNAQSGVTKDVPAGKKMSGSPAVDFWENYKVLAQTRRIPELEKRITALEGQSE